MKKIVLLTETTPSIYDYNKYGLDFFKKKGFDIHILNLNFLLNKKYNETYKLDKSYLDIETIIDFEKNLPENKWLKNKELVNEDLALVNDEGKRVDLEGRIIDENGYYLDEKGNRVDKQGNPLSEDGFYEEIDDEKPKPTRKRAAKKKTTDS